MNGREVKIEVDGDRLIVIQPNLLTDRRARMMFGSVLGATPATDGWHCPQRRGTMEDLAVRINSFLQREGWSVVLTGRASAAVEHAAEQARAFQRTRQAADEFRSGKAHADPAQVRATLTNFGWDNDQRRLLDHQERGLLHGPHCR